MKVEWYLPCSSAASGAVRAPDLVGLNPGLYVEELKTLEIGDWKMCRKKMFLIAEHGSGISVDASDQFLAVGEWSCGTKRKGECPNSSDRSRSRPSLK